MHALKVTSRASALVRREGCRFKSRGSMAVLVERLLRACACG